MCASRCAKTTLQPSRTYVSWRMLYAATRETIDFVRWIFEAREERSHIWCCSSPTAAAAALFAVRHCSVCTTHTVLRMSTFFVFKLRHTYSPVLLPMDGWKNGDVKASDCATSTNSYKCCLLFSAHSFACSSPNTPCTRVYS